MRQNLHLLDMSEYIQNIIIIIIQFVRTATQPLPDLNSDSG